MEVPPARILARSRDRSRNIEDKVDSLEKDLFRFFFSSSRKRRVPIHFEDHIRKIREEMLLYCALIIAKPVLEHLAAKGTHNAIIAPPFMTDWDVTRPHADQRREKRP